MRTVGSADIKTHFYTNMHRAFGTLSKVGVIYKGLKPFVTTFFEPTALLQRWKRKIIVFGTSAQLK